ncbi:MAG: pyridoxal-dependent decarboxylase [Terracidiphilus sp.]|jgi:aromatic-L-amino-acid decarboxylase
MTQNPATLYRDMPMEEFRCHGHELLEWIAKYLEDPRRYPVLARCTPGELQRQLPASGPALGETMEAILRDFEELILPRVTHWNHPHFHAYFSISSSAPGILGELLIAALDANAMLWKSCPAATELEQVTLSWVLEWLGLPAAWFGMIVDSASNAVLQAVVAARQRAEPESRAAGPSGCLVAYVSEQTHSSVEKAVLAAGIGQRNVRQIATDAQFRMKPEALAAAIRADLASNLKPFFVAATIGTTSSTAVDPVAAIAGICRAYGLWLHVDGAYGGSFGILPECRHWLDGVEGADSFIVNPHKLMMVPLDCSLFYSAHPTLLRSAFSLEAEYLKTDAAGAVDFMDYGLALGRRFRALKLWFVLRYFGREGLAAILRENLRMAAWLGERIAEDARFELAAPAAMGLVCFRLRQGEEATKELLRRIHDSGRFFVSHTALAGRFTIRAAIGNIRTTQQDVEELWMATKKCSGRS